MVISCELDGLMNKEIQQESHQSLLFVECLINHTPHFHYQPHLDAVIFSGDKPLPKVISNTNTSPINKDIEVLRLPCSEKNETYSPHETTRNVWTELRTQNMNNQCWMYATVLAAGGEFPLIILTYKYYRNLVLTLTLTLILFLY